MKKFTSLFIFIFFFNIASAQGFRFLKVIDLEDYETALKSAKTKDKMMFVVLHDGAGDFRRMFDNKVFSQPQLSSTAKGFVPLAIDVRDEMGSRWVELFPVDQLPTFFYLNQEEFLVVKSEGYQSADSLAQQASRAKKTENTYSKLLKNYNAKNLSNAQWYQLIKLYSLNFSFVETAALSREYFNQFTKSELLSSVSLELLSTYGVDLETPYPKLIISQKDALSENYKAFNFSDYFERTYSYNLDLALVNSDSLLLKKIVEDLCPHDPAKNSKQQDLLLATYKLYAQETEQLRFWKKGALEALKLLKNDSTKAKLLFDESFEIANNYNTSEAIKISNTMASKSVGYYKQYKNLMLESYTFYLLKEYAKALNLGKQAQSMAQSGKERENAEALVNMIIKEMTP